MPTTTKKKWDKIHKYMLIEDKVVETKKITVHTFLMGDVEDPDLYAAEPLWNWQQSDSGKWVMENAIQKPSWHRHIDIHTYGYRYQIRADLTDEQVTFFELKFK
jgi:hypothetical protein